MSKKLVKSTGTVAGMTMVSRVLGFARDVVLAASFGASPAFDAFVIAFKIPNFFRRLFAEGAFAQAFVPILTEYKMQQSETMVQQFINRVAGTLTVALLAVVIVAEIFVPLLVLVFAPGFVHHPMRYELAKHMLYVTFPYLLLISMAAFGGAVLNAWQRFAIPALTPVMLNVAMISAAFIGVSYFEQPIYVLAWGVIGGGVLQCGMQFYALYRQGLLPRFQLGFGDAHVRRVLKKMVPALFGVSVAQVGLLIDSFFASFLPAGSISWLYYSDRLTFLPLGVIGVALATVVLPHLSRHYTSKSDSAYSQTLDWSLRSLAIIGIPAALGLFLLSGPLLATLMYHGAFGRHDVYMAHLSLMAFSFGLPAFMLVKILASALYSRQNIKSPVKIAALALTVNVILDVVLIGPMHHVGLALATSLASYVNVALLLRVLMREGYYQTQPRWMAFIFRLLLSNLVLAIVVILFRGELSQWLMWSTLMRSVHLLVVIALAVVSYAATLYITGMRLHHFRWAGSE